MKTAIKKISMVELECPVCAEPTLAPNGSFHWDVREMELPGRRFCTCPACNTHLRFPRT